MCFAQPTLPCCKPALQIQPANFHLNGGDVSGCNVERYCRPLGLAADCQTQLRAGDGRQFRLACCDTTWSPSRVKRSYSLEASASVFRPVLGQGRRGRDDWRRQFGSGRKLFQELLASGCGIGVLQ